MNKSCFSCNTAQTRGLTFGQLAVGSIFATPDYPRARIEKLDHFAGQFLGGEDLPIELIGLAKTFEQHDIVQPYNHV